MKQYAPGDEQYGALLKAILTHLDEQQKKRWRTPELVKLQAELVALEAEINDDNSRHDRVKESDDQLFKKRKRLDRCQSIKTEIEHHTDDLHQAERRHREHRRQFEEALAKHLTIVEERKNQTESTFADQDR